MSPFSVRHGADYDRHNGAGELDRYSDMTGTGTLTSEYLADRAQFLAEKIALNLKDETTSDGTIYFQDLASGYEIGTNSVFAADQRFIFGSEASESDLLGGSGDDHLYGGGGSDVLEGQDGRDYLEGNAGNDVLLGGAGRDMLLGQQGFDRLEGGEDDDRLSGGLDTDELRGGAGLDVYYLRSGDGQDTITDSDGLGLIQVDQQLLVGGIRKPDDAADTYTSLDGRFRYVRAGSLEEQWGHCVTLHLGGNELGGSVGRAIRASRGIPINVWPGMSAEQRGGRQCKVKQRPHLFPPPFGTDAWTAVTAELLGLDASLRPIGRPQKLVET